PGAQRRALPFFSDDRLEHLDVESLVGNELLEPPILLFELLQPPRLVDLHASELRFPAVEGGRRDAQFPAHVLHLHAGVGLFERVDDLFLGVPALPHEPYPTRLGSRFAWSTFWGQGQMRPASRHSKKARSRSSRQWIIALQSAWVSMRPGEPRVSRHSSQFGKASVSGSA